MTPVILSHALAFLTGAITGVLGLCLWCVMTEPRLIRPARKSDK